MGDGSEVGAWRPTVEGIEEVFHATFVDHAYPSHTHDTWTLLIVDAGTIRYELDGNEHDSIQESVTLLPPQIPHDGRTVSAGGFRKRVLYLGADVLQGIGRAVDGPTLRDGLLRDRVNRLHRTLLFPDDSFEADSRLAFIVERLQNYLRRLAPDSPVFRDVPLARQLRELIDADPTTKITLNEAGILLHADPTHLIRSFSREFGIAPHQYLTGRRIDLARRHLLDGHRASEVATMVGFHDQAHLNRHFKRMIGTTPAKFARSGSVTRRLASTAD